MSLISEANRSLDEGESQYESPLRTPSTILKSPLQSSRLYFHSSGGRNLEGRKLKISKNPPHTNPNRSPFVSPRINLYNKTFRNQLKNPKSRFGFAFAALAALGSSNLSTVKSFSGKSSPATPESSPNLYQSPIASPVQKIAFTQRISSIRLPESDWVTVRHNKSHKSLLHKTSSPISDSPFTNIFSRIRKHSSPRLNGVSQTKHIFEEHQERLVPNDSSSLEFDTPLRNQILQKDVDDIPVKLKILGQGGFGKVIQANLKGCHIAVKIISKKKSRSRNAEHCIKLERNALFLNHPNIVRTLGVYGFNLESKNAIVIMEYAGSRNLQQVLNDPNEDINENRKLKYAFQIVNAMHCCHENNVVHRDIKPANVIIDKFDNCRLGDFGCSVQLGKEQEKSYVNRPIDGTVVYLAPELLKGQNPTIKADIYSYGISLWQLATREFPFANLNPHVVIYKVAALGVRPSLTNIEENSILKDIFKKCWATDPQERPNSSTIIEIINKYFMM